ncbi:MAG: hypothetical protein RDU30_00325 [Desulfovibrionaceae bacterium]|nr:hypothetical protein [Desulfovibrionaceae bacterium]
MYSNNRTFTSLCLDGEADLTDIDDYIEAWHLNNDDRPLNEYLGLSSTEYELWMKKPESLRYILNCKRFGEQISSTYERDCELPFAARASSVSKMQEVQDWLTKRK